MKIYRIALLLFCLLPIPWEGMAETENPQQKTVSQIVFLVH